jgi:Fe-S-cluster containining protein
LITFRKGEHVYDNVQDQILPLDQELVRIRSKPGTPACFFYDHFQRSCGIYAQRPLECRLFACWDPTDLVQAYARDRIQRLDLIPAHSGLGQLIKDHEQMCPWNRVLELVPNLRQNPDSAEGMEIAKILKMDLGLRQALRDRAGADEVVLEFILGRSMVSVLPSLGLEAATTGNGFHLQVRRS